MRSRYPGICRRAFEILSCRQIGPTYAVIDKDYTGICGNEWHHAHVAVAFFIIVFFSFGVPIALFVKMARVFALIRTACQGIQDAEAKPNLKMQDDAADHDTIDSPFLSKKKRALLAVAVANDVQCTPDEASDAIAEILENKAYSVVMVSSCPPRIHAHSFG